MCTRRALSNVHTERGEVRGEVSVSGRFQREHTHTNTNTHTLHTNNEHNAQHRTQNMKVASTVLLTKICLVIT